MSRFQQLAESYNKNLFITLHEEMSFTDYIELVYKEPRLVRTAYQRIYDMIMSDGTSQFKRYRHTYTHYNFFDKAEVPIYGLEKTLENIVQFIRGAAGGYGPEKRVLLLHGPVGSSKSTICRVIKRGMEKYSQTDAGRWYTFKWVNLPVGPEGLYTHTEDECPMNEDPIKLIPEPIRKKMLKELNEILASQTTEDQRACLYELSSNGELDPRCKKFMNELLKRNGGNWEEVVRKHIRVIRKVYSEADRCGIATFQPKDEKNQDATELTGDINYAKLSHFGSDSDPRAFEFNGEFCSSNRGFCEFIEMLKLAQEFLYDLLGASQEQQIKPKKFPQVSVDLALFGHSNNPEYEKLKSNPSMEALRDRTIKIDVPYLLRWSDEQEILKHYYGNVKQHVAPHTIEIAALFAILTRLEDDKDGKLTLIQKAKLYDGKVMPGYTEDSVKELRDKHPAEGMFGGVSCRYIQDKISNCLASHHDYINAFMVLNELAEGLEHSSLFTDKNDIHKYRNAIDLTKKELEEILKKEVQEALVGNKESIVRLCANYIDNVVAYINKKKVRNPITEQDQLPDERLMRSIEEKIDIPELGADEFRRSLAMFMGSLAAEGQTFHWDSNPRLKEALEKKLFEDTKDHINLSKLSMRESSVVDKGLQEKIDLVKQRLIDKYGYNEKSATDVLDHVSSIFARGDSSN